MGHSTPYKVVELSTAQRLPNGKSDKELQESVATLNSHPGFIWLTQRLDVMNAALKAKLAQERHTDLKDVQFLQAGIYWSNWLRQEVALATRAPHNKPLDAYDEELKAFQEIDALIERVGE
jgi:hypothetical protein